MGAGRIDRVKKGIWLALLYTCIWCMLTVVASYTIGAGPVSYTHLIGKNDFWEKGKWAFTLFFGVMYMLAEYGTLKMANNIASVSYTHLINSTHKVRKRI